MKSLFFCNTNFQLIVAMQIAASFNKESSIIITNEINNCEEIVHNLRDTRLFDHIALLDVKTSTKSIDLIRQCIFGMAPNGMDNIYFDEFVGFNFDIPSHIVFAFLYRKNPNIIVNKMEEGLMSLNTPETTCGVLEVSYRIRKLLHKKNLKEIVSGFYCFSPKANKTGIDSILIPAIRSDSNIREYLKIVFCKNAKFEYKENVIFLSCIYDIEGGSPIGELELAKKIAVKVGTENLLVKVHPRDDKEKYIQAGLNVDNNSSVPFEVIQIYNDFSDKILVTTLSGSILNFNVILESAPLSYYGYKLCKLDANPLALHYREVLEGYLNGDDLGLRNIYVMNNIEELLNG